MHSFTIDVPDRKQVTVSAVAQDGGDMAWGWKRKAAGSYRLHLDVDVSSEELKK